MPGSIVPRLTIAMALLAGVISGWSALSSTAAQSQPSQERFGFAAQLPNIHDQTGLVSTYGFRWLTPENAMKMETIGGCDGVYDFGPADQLLAIAGDLDMQVHGHTLVWHNQTSICADAYTRE